MFHTLYLSATGEPAGRDRQGPTTMMMKMMTMGVGVLELVPRLISTSELLSQQHLPCVSNLSWSTNHQRAWVKEAELSLPGHQALRRVNLLLIGCLEEGQMGEWRLRDTSGSVRCEVGPGRGES